MKIQKGPEWVEPTPVDPVSMEFQVMQGRIAALTERVFQLEHMLRANAMHAYGAGGMGSIHPFIIAGPVISAPDSQDVVVCNWDSVTVIVSRPDWFGPGARPVAGASVEFSITNSLGTTGPQISTGPNGTGLVKKAGGNLTVKTNAQGEATIYVHDAAPSKIVLKADMSGAFSQDIVINFK